MRVEVSEKLEKSAGGRHSYGERCDALARCVCERVAKYGETFARGRHSAVRGWIGIITETIAVRTRSFFRSLERFAMETSLVF